MFIENRHKELEKAIFESCQNAPYRVRRAVAMDIGEKLIKNLRKAISNVLT